LASLERLQSVQIRLLGRRSLPHSLLHVPPRTLSMLSLQSATPSLAASAVNIPFHFTFNLKISNLKRTLPTISTCTPSGRIGSADVGSSHPPILSTASRMDWTSLMADVIVTDPRLAVIIRGCGMHQQLLLPYRSHRYSVGLYGTVVVRFLSQTSILSSRLRFTSDTCTPLGSLGLVCKVTYNRSMTSHICTRPSAV